MPQYFYDHVHLYSADPLKAAEFYEKLFAAKRVAVRPTRDGKVNVELSLNGSRVLIAPASKPMDGTVGGLDHWGIRTDNIEEAVANLKANGVKFRNEIVEFRPGVKIAFFWAPDNVLIEILEIKPVSS